MGNYLSSSSDYSKAAPIAVLLMLELSPAHPVRRTLTFIKQLWGQVSK